MGGHAVSFRQIDKTGCMAGPCWSIDLNDSRPGPCRPRSLKRKRWGAQVEKDGTPPHEQAQASLLARVGEGRLKMVPAKSAGACPHGCWYSAP